MNLEPLVIERSQVLSSRRAPVALSILLLIQLAGCAGPVDDTSVTEEPSPTATLGTAVVSVEGDQLGTVHLPTSCPEIQVELERGQALLHHMNYVRSEAVFRGALETDPECALAYWGTAMTYVHPLWPDTISPEKRVAGEELLAKAAAAAHTSERENAYIEALASYYEGEDRTERERLASYLESWTAVHTANPDDTEAALFHALALLANAPAEDKTYQKQIEAGQIIEGVFARIPRHPGAHHYTIHAYDFPPLAERALDIARRYDDLAPENTHALHMTSHIFTRLGLWPESIEFNERAAAAASDRTAGGAVSLHHLHALDYLAYAHLQRADDEAADRVLAAISALEPPFQNHSATAYAFAAVPARLALERHDWKAAAEIGIRSPAELEWDQYPYLDAIPYFARALGAARTGQPDAARAAIDELERLEEKARALDIAYDWGIQVAIQRVAAEAWLAYESGDTEAALELAREAAEIEGTTEKNPVTPGEVLPARELYGDMLLAAGRHSEAITAYEAALDRSPNRFNSLYGAGRAAELAGQREMAESFYEKLLGVCSGPTGARPELEHARESLGMATSV
jgi:tetratricopeptide (TPR) repeat protein